MNRTRSQFTHGSILNKIRSYFKSHPDIKNIDRSQISTVDCLMSGISIFALKYPSLLKFDMDVRAQRIQHNLKTLYGVEQAPCDTYLRERLDEVPLKPIQGIFASLFALLQRSKVLEQWQYIDGKYLVNLDGTGFFSSDTIHCTQCCEKVHRKGTDTESRTYHHDMLVGAIANPNMRQVIPLDFEPIIKEDGVQKNDCERNAAKRWLRSFRFHHPQLPVILCADGLYANAPFIKELERHRCSYILVAKSNDHRYLWDYFWAAEKPDVEEYEIKNDKVLKKYRFMKNVPLNDANADVLVNVIYYEEINKKGEKKTWGWVTDLDTTMQTVSTIVKGGRCRWKIENETFNTLKNQGYHYEHNFGHGKKGLCNLLAGLMLLAFFIDQCLEVVNLEFQEALKKKVFKSHLWEHIRSLFLHFFITTWENLYNAILDPPRMVI